MFIFAEIYILCTMVLHFKKAYLALIGKDFNEGILVKKKTGLIFPIAIAVLLCIGIWSGGMILTHWYANNHFDVPKDANSPALFGDSFGAVNALISAFAFAGVIVSMYLQRKDLEMQRESIDIQRKELQQNTKELELQRREFESQNKTMRLQRFENTFFNMLSLQQEIVNGLHYTYLLRGSGLSHATIEERKTNLITGRDVFEYIFIHYCIYSISKKGNHAYFIKEISLFAHYFRHLYRIVKFIDETTLLETKKEKYSYLCILRAALSKYELIHLYYNSIQFPKFKALIEEYSLLNNIDISTLPPDGAEGLFSEDDPYEETAYEPSIKGYNTSD